MSEKLDSKEGYVYVSYGGEKYLRHVIASVLSLRRYDTKRPVAIVCNQNHKELLESNGMVAMFDIVHVIPPQYCSIVGFKHQLHNFLFYRRNIFLDSDIIWCKSPDRLWTSFKPYAFTITGKLKADVFFGAAKGLGILKTILLRERKKTLRDFGLSYLSRVQSGVIYAEDRELTERVCLLASDYLSKIDQTHFQSRLNESGRNMESCEWSLAMAMAKMNLSVYPWMNGHESPQLDFIDNYTTYDKDFKEVKCKYYTDSFVYGLRGLRQNWLQKFLTNVAGLSPGKNDYIMVTPYCLHFGWLHEKQPFLDFADDMYEKIKTGELPMPIQNESSKFKKVDNLLEKLS